MIYLLLEIACSSIITLIFKIAAFHRWNGKDIIFVNYIYASTFYLINVLLSFGGIPFSALSGATPGNVLTNATPGNSMLVAIIVGLVQGVLYVTLLVTSERSVANNGAGLSSFFNKSSFIATTILVALIWHEFPTKIQVIGMGMIFAALIIMIINLKHLDVKAPHLFAVNLGTSVCSQLCNKAFGKYALSEYKVVYMMFVFSMALISFIVSHKYITKEKVMAAIKRPATLISGIALGAANSLSSLFQLKALEVLGASVVYPAFAAGNLLVVFLVGTLVFHEKSTWNELIAMALLLIALVLVNL